MPLPPTPPTAATLDWAPFEIVIFDCDSTLSTVEGIDEIARWTGKQAEVAELTHRAMNGELPLEAVYSRRLELLNPTRAEIQQLGRLYRETLVPDAREVITTLQHLGRQVYIVSGGLAEGVRDFGLWLGLPEAHIHAVEVEYNQLTGNWWETWKHPGGRNPGEQVLGHDGGPLTIGAGKAQLIRRLRRTQRGRALLVGDGISDLEASAEVDLFVGFGGVVDRERVRAQAPVFVQTPELAPILPLAIARHGRLPAEATDLFQRGVARLYDGSVRFRDPAQHAALLAHLPRP